jgi:hypothetical protein
MRLSSLAFLLVCGLEPANPLNPIQLIPGIRLPVVASETPRN